MVDEHTQRPYRSNELPDRGQPAKESGSSSDPLAELARLIGQNDPFADRDAARRVAPPRPRDRSIEPPHDWDVQPAGAGYSDAPNTPNSNMGSNDYYDPASVPAAPPQNFGRPQFGGAPLASGADLYQVENEVPGYPPAHPAANDDGRYNPNNAQLAPEEEGFYDDEPPSRRRMGIMVIAGIFALAVIGTAGAFGYRALFGTSSSSLPPPVIKADSAPSKIVPASNLNTQSNKQITDRVNDRGLGEKLVSREEQPVGISPQLQDSGPAPIGSGIVGSEPKKVRTIAIHPDQPVDAMPASTPPPTRATATTPAKLAPPAPASRVVSNQPPAAADSEPAPAPRPAVARAVPAPANSPLSLNPDAAPAASRPAAAARTAAVAAPAPIAATASNGGNGYAVQVSSQRSEAEAQAAFRNLQAKYPGQLGGKQPVITRADLGDKGIYFRAMVPAATGSEATELCSSLKSAGGSCIIQRN